MNHDWVSNVHFIAFVTKYWFTQVNRSYIIAHKKMDHLYCTTNYTSTNRFHNWQQIQNFLVWNYMS